MNTITRRWRFRIEHENGDGCYVGPDGRQDSESEWIGTDSAASIEAQRRADAWEDATNSLCPGVAFESRGQVPRPKTPDASHAHVTINDSSDYTTTISIGAPPCEHRHGTYRTIPARVFGRRRVFVCDNCQSILDSETRIEV